MERINQEAKNVIASEAKQSEAGWDDLEAGKYRAWEYHLALVILATWFVAQKWTQQRARDPALAQQFEVEGLPALSMANIRALLRAAMPLPPLTPEEAASPVVEHFVNRTRSHKSRLNRMRSTHNANAPP